MIPIQRARHLLISPLPLLGFLCVLLLSACSGVTPVGATPGTTTSPAQPPTPTSTAATGSQAGQLLLKSAQALGQVQFVHLDLKSHGTLQGTGFQLPGGAQSSTYTLTAHSDIAVKSQAEKGRLALTLVPNGQKGSTTVKVSEILFGQKLYLRVGTGQAWQVIDLAALQAQAAQATGGFPGAQTVLQLAQEHLSIVDRGVSTAKQVRLHHVTITLDQQGMEAFVAALPPSMLKQALGDIHLLRPITLDLFLDEATALPVRLVISRKVALGGNTLLALLRQMQQRATSQNPSAELTLTATISLSHYNHPLQIRPPAVPNTPSTNGGQA